MVTDAFVDGFVSLHVAPATTAPLVSWTVPLSVLETVCAMADIARSRIPPARMMVRNDGGSSVAAACSRIVISVPPVFRSIHPTDPVIASGPTSHSPGVVDRVGDHGLAVRRYSRAELGGAGILLVGGHGLFCDIPLHRAIHMLGDAKLDGLRLVVSNFDFEG